MPQACVLPTAYTWNIHQAANNRAESPQHVDEANTADEGQHGEVTDLVCVCVFIYIYMHIHIYVYICIHIYIYVYARHTHMGKTQLCIITCRTHARQYACASSRMRIHFCTLATHAYTHQNCMHIQREYKCAYCDHKQHTRQTRRQLLKTKPNRWRLLPNSTCNLQQHCATPNLLCQPRLLYLKLEPLQSSCQLSLEELDSTL